MHSTQNMYNANDLQLQLNNALQRIHQLESASISPINNQTLRNSTGNSGLTLTEELQRSFPSLGNLRSRPNHTLTPTSSPTVSCSTNTATNSTQMPLTAASSSGFVVNKKKRKRRSTPKVKAVHKDLVLVPDPLQTTVPTHSARVMLESDGYVLHSFLFIRDWDHVHLKNEIIKVFPQIQLCGYEYMKVSFVHTT